MLAAFWEGLGTKLADRWVATVLTPAFAFWIGGAVAWWSGHEGGTVRLRAASGELDRLPAVMEAAAVVAVLILVVASGLALEAATPALLRELEGYWPRWLRPLRRRLIDRQLASARVADARYQQLAHKAYEGELTADEEEEFVASDRQRLLAPANPAHRLPTRLGNVLRAAETRSWDKYGLESTVCWPRLWLLLPGQVRDEIGEARAHLDSAARLCAWGGIFVIWTFWAWWAAPAGVALAALGHRRALAAAEVYGDLVESAFDLHRLALYRALRWPVPSGPADETTLGKELTHYLLRGRESGPLTFTQAEQAAAS